MQTSRFHSITSRFSPARLRTSFRRSSSASSASDRSSYSCAASDELGLGLSSRGSASSPVSIHTINSIMFRQPSIVGLEEERRSFCHGELELLEPRPIVYWGSVEERMASLNSL